MKVIIAGSRTIHNSDELTEAIKKSKFIIDTVISGGCRGVDTLGEIWAHDNDKNLIVMEADWERYGRSAGYRRNCDMAEVGDALIALWDGSSRGTKHMIDIARAKGLQVYVQLIS